MGQKPEDDVPEGEALFVAFVEALQRETRAGRAGQAEAVAADLLSHASEEAARDPDPHLRLKEQARRCEEQADWAGAESLYRQALALRQAQNDLHGAFKDHLDLGGLLWLRDRRAAALAEVEAAVEIGRRAEFASLLLMGLDVQARHLLALGERDAAGAVVAEMLALTSEPGPNELMRARALILRARCVMDDSADEAAADLEAAWGLLSPMAGALVMAGYQSALAAWWEATAALRANRGQAAGAAQALAEAVAIRRGVAAQPHVAGPYTADALARSLIRWGQSLEVIGDVTGAAEAIAEGRAIRERLGLSSEPAPP